LTFHAVEKTGGENTLLKSHGNYREETGEFEFTCLRQEDMSFLFNALPLELKDHNKAQIRPHFVSRTLVDRDFQHTINSLHFLIRGGATLFFEGQTHQLTAGDVFLIGNHVKCTWEYTEPSEEMTFLFNVYIGSMDDLFEHLAAPLILHGEEAAAGEADRLFRESTGLSLLSLRHLLLSYLLRFLAQSGADIDGHVQKAKKYGEVFRYISEHLSASLTLERIARDTNYSVSFFTKRFPRDNGMTVKQYIHDQLMSEAEQLLIYTDHSIGEISDRLGFCEQAYFTRWFKRYKAAPPGEYRAALRRVTENGGLFFGLG
jgi:AraC-like DNA-binding protein